MEKHQTGNFSPENRSPEVNPAGPEVIPGGPELERPARPGSPVTSNGQDQPDNSGTVRRGRPGSQTVKTRPTAKPISRQPEINQRLETLKTIVRTSRPQEQKQQLIDQVLPQAPPRSGPS